MATRALQQVITYVAWDTSANAFKTGDSANHTTSWCKDGTRSATTNATAEVDATNLPGLYKVTMTSTETDCIEGVLGGKSSTANVVLIPTMVAFDYLNTSAPTTAGIPDVNAKNIGNTAQTGRDIGASVLLSAGIGAGQLDFTSGVVKANATQWLSGTIPAVNVTGVPLVDLKYTLGTISPAAAGSVGIDWAQVANKTSAVNLSATQIQSVNNLAAGSDSISTTATSGSTLTTGSAVSGTFASTVQLDGVYWQIADTAGTLDMYFEFNVGATGVPTTAIWDGALTAVVNTLKVFAFNWAGSSWDQVGTLLGIASLIVGEQQYDFTTAHVGTGGNLGLVRLRFQNTGLTTANFYTDRVLCGFTNSYTFPTNFAALGITAGGHITTTDTVTNQLTAAQIATGIWQDATAGDFTTASSIGKSLFTSGNAPGAANGLALVGSNVGVATSVSGAVGSVTGNVGGNVTGSVGSVVGAVGSVTGNVGGNVVGSVGSVTAGVTVATNNDKTGYGITSNVKKNSSSRVSFTMTDSTTHAPKTGLAVASAVSIDGGAFGATANSVNEVSRGDYTLVLAAADTNGNDIMFNFTAAGADDLNLEFVTQP